MCVLTGWATSAWFDANLVEFGTLPVPFLTPNSPVVVLLCDRLLVESIDAGGPGKPRFYRTTLMPVGSVRIRFAYIRVRCSYTKVKIGTDLYKTILPMVKQQVPFLAQNPFPALSLPADYF